MAYPCRALPSPAANWRCGLKKIRCLRSSVPFLQDGHTLIPCPGSEANQKDGGMAGGNVVLREALPGGLESRSWRKLLSASLPFGNLNIQPARDSASTFHFLKKGIRNALIRPAQREQAAKEARTPNSEEAWHVHERNGDSRYTKEGSFASAKPASAAALPEDCGFRCHREHGDGAKGLPSAHVLTYARWAHQVRHGPRDCPRSPALHRSLCRGQSAC